MSPAARAQAAHAAAEVAREAGDLKTAAALKSAAGTWERLARNRPGGWSHEPLRRELQAVKREIVSATGPCQPPRSPKAPRPSQAVPERLTSTGFQAQNLPRTQATIDF
jgi:hypothetical protein